MADKIKLRDLNFDPAVDHIDEYVEGYMTDRVQCSCGWRSNPYWDGADLAEGEFKKHENGLHVFVLGFERDGCECHPDCEETFKTMEIRRLEEKLARLKSGS